MLGGGSNILSGSKLDLGNRFMEAGMKKYILVVLIALAFLFVGPQTVFSQTDTAPDRGNAVPAEALPEDLQGVAVKDYYIDSAARPAGFLRTVIGHVVVVHEDTGQAFFAAAGDAVFKHDAIFTLEDARCRIKFTTDDIITMGEKARIGISEYIDDRVRKKKTSIFSMLRGKAMFYALRLFKYRSVSSSVKTPTAIIGVRGTKFGVEVVEIDAKIAQSTPIYLADASGSGAQYLAREAGKKTKTKVHCFRGGLDVTSEGITQPVEEGKTWEDNKVGDTRPEDKQNFEDATRAPDPETSKDEGKDDEAGQTAANEGGDQGSVDSGSTDTTDTGAEDQAESAASTTTNQTNSASGSTTPQGYFSGMLSDLSYPDYPYLDDVYVSSSRQDFGSGTVRADNLNNAGGFVDGSTVDGFDNPHLKQVRVHSTAVSADNLGLPVTTSAIGSNTYMEWGYWYVADSFIVVSSNYPYNIEHNLRHKGYYIFGAPTPDASVAGISGYYTGPAYGTYYDDMGSGAPQGIDMTGYFDCYVNGPNGTIESFYLNVTSGGGEVAAISGASGSMNGSSFDITGGDWSLNGTSFNVMGGGQGSLYGPNGEHIGGAWGMMKIDSGNDGAVGIFQGAPGGY